MSDKFDDLFNEESKNEENEKSVVEEVNTESVKSDNENEYHFKGNGEKENLYSNSTYYSQTTQPQASANAQPVNTNNPYNANAQQRAYGNTQYSGYTNPYSSQNPNVYSNPYNTNTAQGYNANNQQTNAYNPYNYSAPVTTKKKEKKNGVSKGFVALIVVLSVVLSSLIGFGGAMLYTNMKVKDAEISTNGAMIINKVDIDEKTAEELSDKPTSQITEEVADTVVEITTEVMSTNSFYGQYISQGAGSGVIISSDGYIVTNNHVIDGATSITVTLRDKTTYEAKLVGTDSIVDVALLKIDATGLKAATFGDSDDLKVGDKAVAIGNPLGQLGGTVTDGIISALDRDVVIDGETMNLLQTDTAINPGNSGGGLFDGQGALVGVVVAKSSGEEIEGLGFAIPINDVIDILDDLKEYGYETTCASACTPTRCARSAAHTPRSRLRRTPCPAARRPRQK